jgi:hypothetical protein
LLHLKLCMTYHTHLPSKRVVCQLSKIISSRCCFLACFYMC